MGSDEASAPLPEEPKKGRGLFSMSSLEHPRVGDFLDFGSRARKGTPLSKEGPPLAQSSSQEAPATDVAAAPGGDNTASGLSSARGDQQGVSSTGPGGVPGGVAGSMWGGGRKSKKRDPRSASVWGPTVA